MRQREGIACAVGRAAIAPSWMRWPDQEEAGRGHCEDRERGQAQVR